MFIWSPYGSHARNCWVASHLGVFGGGSPSEEFVADDALAHAPADDDERLADLVGAGGAIAPLRFFAGSQCCP